jgi:hypothetical protein
MSKGLLSVVLSERKHMLDRGRTIPVLICNLFVFRNDTKDDGFVHQVSGFILLVFTLEF